MPRLLGIDHGARKIGLALSDETGLVARPLSILIHRSAAEDAAAIARLAEAEGVSRIVVGLPLDDDGEEGPRARRVRRWAEAVQQQCKLPLDYWDESFSTSTVAGEGRRRRKSHSRGSAGRAASGADDAEAAAVILQEYLDAHRQP
jgi:putative Holliday junction resolvase